MYGIEVKPPPHLLEISRVGNLIMVKWSLKYVASKWTFCFNKYQKYFLYAKKKKNQNFKLHVGTF